MKLEERYFLIPGCVEDRFTQGKKKKVAKYTLKSHADLVHRLSSYLFLPAVLDYYLFDCK